MAGKKALWAVQLQEWPESVQLSVAEMMDWVNTTTKTGWRREQLLTQIIYCLEYPSGVFYRTSESPDAFVGFRFGLKGRQYQSGFPLWNGEYGC